jgi:RimJ/RimL family protein N-acetyltransferase
MVAVTAERDAFLAAEEDAWRGWDLAVRAVPPSHADEVIADGRSTKQLVTHMAAWHAWGAERLADRLAGREQTRYPDWHAFEDAFNRKWDERGRAMTWQEALDEASARYAAFRSRVEELDEEQLWIEKGLIAACGSRHYGEYIDAVHALLHRVPPLTSFQTPRLRLRSLRPSDAPAIFEMFSDPEVMRFIPPSPNALTVDRVRRGIARRMALERESGLTLWLVQRRDTGETIGQCGFALVEGTGPDVEIAYHDVRRAWGQGYATEAAVACLERGFGALGFERVIAICYPENVASWRVMEKAGMTFDGEGDHYGVRMKRYVADRTWRPPRGSS